MEGTVKFYNWKKRFGFITADDGTDYFFHQTGLQPGTKINDGDKVSFEVVDGDKGPKAEKINVLGKAEKTAEDSGDSDEPTDEEPVEEDTDNENSDEE